MSNIMNIGNVFITNAMVTNFGIGYMVVLTFFGISFICLHFYDRKIGRTS